MNIREALRWARERLRASPTPHEDARALLQHVLSVEHTHVAANSQQALSAEQEDRFRAFVLRAQELEPIPYITGEASFYGLDFAVTPAVLIPRPETELLVDEAVAWAKERPGPLIVDVGTGSGCIAVLLARRLPPAHLIAVDVSQAALDIARRNIERHGVTRRIDLRQTTILEGIDEPVDLIVANLPYITDAEWTVLDDAVKWYEPVTALRGGPDGLDLIRRLLRQAKAQLRPGGAIFLEIGWRQGDAARDMAQTFFPEAQITVKLDYAGRDRLVAIDTPE